MSAGTERIGLLGGTFDPVHNGHLAIAGLALEKMALARVLFIPAADPPHKKSPGASFRQRLAMLELALAADRETCTVVGGRQKNFAISLLEAELPVPSYTVDTLVALRQRMGEQEFHFIIGGDSLLELHLWYRFRELLRLSNFIVAVRPGIPLDAMISAIKNLPGSFRADSSGTCWSSPDGAKISLITIFADTISEDISSSAIRLQLQQGERPVGMAPQVLEYICRHDLYKI